jgi:serine phosphatase RsbU (regulator of sigma subunit)
VIGLIESFPFKQASVTLEPGDLLVLYTDGVSEAMWGEARMTETSSAARGSAPRIHWRTWWLVLMLSPLARPSTTI